MRLIVIVLVGRYTREGRSRTEVSDARLIKYTGRATMVGVALIMFVLRYTCEARVQR